MMKDPAWGPTKASRAFGKDTPYVYGKSKQFYKPTDLRIDNNGMFSGPRPTYGRYRVSPNATDAVIRGRRVNP